MEKLVTIEKIDGVVLIKFDFNEISIDQREEIRKVLNPLLEMIIGGCLLMITYLFSILYTGALTRSNIDDMYSIASKYEKFTPITYRSVRRSVYKLAEPRPPRAEPLPGWAHHNLDRPT